MNDLDKYKNIFFRVFSLLESDLEKNPSMQNVELWDSIGHINLITELEDAFNIEITIEEMSEFTSYEKGKSILEHHGVKL